MLETRYGLLPNALESVWQLSDEGVCTMSDATTHDVTYIYDHTKTRKAIRC